MGAREKLNQASFAGSLLIAAFAGGLTGSWWVFIITAAILDYRLQGGTADDLCKLLVQRKIPFVIYSGYPNVEGECNRWEIVSKPADPRLLVTLVLSVLVAHQAVQIPEN